MQVIPDDVLAGVKTAWAGSDLPDLVPGGLWHGRPETGADMPYASAKVTEGDREEFSGATYLQKFRVEIAVWTNATPPDSGPIRRAMATLLDRGSLNVPNADNVTHVKPLPGKLEQDREQREATDVLVAGGAWEVLIEATRVND